MSSEHLKIGPYNDSHFFVSCPEKYMDDYLDLMKRFKARRNMNAKGYGSGWTVPKEYREELVEYFGLSDAKPKYQPAPKTKYETKLQTKRKGDDSEDDESSEDEQDSPHQKSSSRNRSPSPKRSSRRSRSHEDEDEIEELTQKMKELSSRLDKLKRK